MDSEQAIMINLYYQQQFSVVLHIKLKGIPDNCSISVSAVINSRNSSSFYANLNNT